MIRKILHLFSYSFLTHFSFDQLQSYLLLNEQVNQKHIHPTEQTKMKRMDLFCSSPASTAITCSVDHLSTMRRSSKSHERRKNQLPHVPCSSQLPIIPKAYLEKHRKSTSSASADNRQNKSSDTRRKSSVHVNDLYSTHPKVDSSSTRYLLGDAPFVDWVDESSKITTLIPQLDAKDKSMVVKRNDSPALKSSSSPHSKDQVVVLRVSLHCKACEGKVRKHISKMEGVRSFSIDKETKKVIIIGDVTPIGVLESVSKVKNAELWTSPTSSWTTTFPSSTRHY